MCVRSKTTYGCGCIHKTTRQCHSLVCSGTDRYHHVKDGICPDCENEGAVVLSNKSSRKRSGTGRCMQTPSKFRRSEMFNSSNEDVSSAGYDVSGGASPWAAPTKAEKTWQTPHRKKADEAWLSEHEARLFDLQDRMEKTHISDSPSQPETTKDVMIVPEDYDYDDYNDDDYILIRNSSSKKIGHGEPRRHLECRAEQPRSHQHEDRQHSHDSLPDTMPSYRSSPKLRHASVSSIINAYPEAFHDHDHSEDSPRRSSKHTHRRHRHTHSQSKTEPYISGRYGYESDYDLAPAPPPIQMPPAATPLYDTYDYYATNMTPPTAQYTYTGFPYDSGHPPPSGPQHYDNYQRY